MDSDRKSYCLDETIETVIQVIESAIGARDPYTVYHQQCVAQLACNLGYELGLSPERLRALRLAGTIHDLGKIAIPAAILTKPGRLTPLEFAMVRSHPQVGYDILKPIKFPGQVRQIVLQHHERINGTGYPYGLKGEEILLEARILGVADVMEAMCSHRPYRPPLGLEKALEEISKHKGSLYEAVVVEACWKLYEAGVSHQGRLLASSLSPDFPSNLAVNFAYAY